jgi:hypothetical protein
MADIPVGFNSDELMPPKDEIQSHFQCRGKDHGTNDQVRRR